VCPGYDTTMAKLIAVFGAAKPHHAYLFADHVFFP
jgi:hypothetical protein